jgi:hypothetical protein
MHIDERLCEDTEGKRPSVKERDPRRKETF